MLCNAVAWENSVRKPLLVSVQEAEKMRRFCWEFLLRFCRLLAFREKQPLVVASCPTTCVGSAMPNVQKTLHHKQPLGLSLSMINPKTWE